MVARFKPRTIALFWLGYWLLLFISTHVPIPKAAPQIRHGDKVAHFIAYAGLTLLGAWRLHAREQLCIKSVSFWAAVYCAFGAMDELLQPLVGRTLSLWDWLADALGVAAATLAIAAFWPRKLSKRVGPT